jgi:hypothetical protein
MTPTKVMKFRAADPIKFTASWAVIHAEPNLQR